MPPRFPDDRGVTPAVGVVLMIAIVVALAALFGVFATGISPPDSTPTNLAYDAAYVEDGAGNVGDRPYVNVTFTAGRENLGDDVYITDSDGNEVAWSSVWTGGDYVEAGETLKLDGYGSDDPLNNACHGEVYRVVRRPDSGRSELIIKVRIQGYATGAAASYC